MQKWIEYYKLLSSDMYQVTQGSQNLSTVLACRGTGLALDKFGDKVNFANRLMNENDGNIKQELLNYLINLSNL